MRQVWDEIDLHVIRILLVVAPGMCIGWWWLIIVLMIPQGRIGVRAFWDYPSVGVRRWVYLFANEVLVISGVGLLAGLRTAGECLMRSALK